MKDPKIREAAKASAEALGKLEEALELEDEQDSENARLQEELNASQAENDRWRENEELRSTSRSVSRASADGPRAKAQYPSPYPSARHEMLYARIAGGGG